MDPSNPDPQHCRLRYEYVSCVRAPIHTGNYKVQFSTSVFKFFVCSDQGQDCLIALGVRVNLDGK